MVFVLTFDVLNCPIRKQTQMRRFQWIK